jgi:hypothetical protein
MSAAEQFHVREVSSSYWRVNFDNGPVNVLDPDTIEGSGPGWPGVRAGGQARQPSRRARPRTAPGRGRAPGRAVTARRKAIGKKQVNRERSGP